MTLAETLRAASIVDICAGAGVTQPTVTRLRKLADAGEEIRWSPARERIREFCESLAVNGHEKRGPGAERVEEGSPSHQKLMAEIDVKREDARKRKRDNDLADGKLIDADEVNARIATAANEFRAGAETLRRDVLAAVPVRSRKAVRAALDAGLERLRGRVAGALGG